MFMAQLMLIIYDSRTVTSSTFKSASKDGEVLLIGGKPVTRAPHFDNVYTTVI